MGLFDALTSAVSGLQAQAFAMQNISGNIANSQTIAYKGVNTSFLDLIPGDDNPTQQVAGGVIANSSRDEHRARRNPERDVANRHRHQWRRLLRCANANQLQWHHSGLQRGGELYKARRLPAEFAGLSGQWRRLLSRRHSDRSDDRESVRQHSGSSAIPEQLSAGRANDANHLWRQPPGETDHALVQRRGGQFRTSQSDELHRRSDGRRDRNCRWRRRVNVRERVGQRRRGDDLRRDRHAGQPPDAMGKDG